MSDTNKKCRDCKYYDGILCKNKKDYYLCHMDKSLFEPKDEKEVAK